MQVESKKPSFPEENCDFLLPSLLAFEVGTQLQGATKPPLELAGGTP